MRLSCTVSVLRCGRERLRRCLGANGAGKTTLMRTLSGLLPLRSGSILYRGRELGTVDTAERVAAGLVLIPEGRLVFPDLTVEQNLRLGAYTPRARAGRSKRLDEMYGMFRRLRERRTQAAGTLSGGEQQMLGDRARIDVGSGTPAS